MKLVKLATCNLAQWALDFTGNCNRIVESIRIAKQQGARYRLGPELEVSGYGCEDHFLEVDTYQHCWEVIAEILQGDVTDGILCDIGMPVMHKSVRYNSDDGNYRESRWFTPWPHRFKVEPHYLPRFIRAITGQDQVPFGEGCLSLRDTIVSVETCEELFTANSPHIAHFLNGVEIIGNGSGSHHQLRKLQARFDLIREATLKAGGIYLYANQQCCDGGRLYYDGGAMIFCNGELIAQGSQFSPLDVEVVTAVADLGAVRAFRGAPSRAHQAAVSAHVPRIDVDFELSEPTFVAARYKHIGTPSQPITPKFLTVEEEIGFGPACWLWDYLRRSGMNGFFLPLSGGADSSAVAAIVGVMCHMLLDHIRRGNGQVLADVRRVAQYKPDEYPASAEELCGRIFTTCYMGSKNSSEATRIRAETLAKQIGANHYSVVIDDIVSSFESLVSKTLGKQPKFKVYGGTDTENLALQNVQARSRMVLGYMMAQLALWSKDRKGSLLVLGSANVDEGLRGYLTKYDCSSADLNPIGAISKVDLKRFLLWAADKYGWTALKDVVEAPPTAELEPITQEYRQTDEEDMGMTYAELSEFGKLRKIDKCGPLLMFQKLVTKWTDLTPTQVATKVKRFFRYYSINRHKMTTITPSYHAENYSCDDNRYDLRPFLYNSNWTWQFERIDALAKELEQQRAQEAIERDSVAASSAASMSSDQLNVQELLSQLQSAQEHIRTLEEQLKNKSSAETPDDISAQTSITPVR